MKNISLPLHPRRRKFSYTATFFFFFILIGGVAGKHKGRVGDAPLVGCGGYANEIGAATATGRGELIIKMTLTREVVYNMENGQNAQVI